MKNQKEMQLEKMLDVLSKLGLNSIHLENAEKYLMEEGQEELLSGIPKQDFSKLNNKIQEECSDVFNKLLSRKQYDEVARLFNIVFQMGGSTTSLVFPMYNLRSHGFSEELKRRIEKYKLVAVFAEDIVYYLYLNWDSIKNILNLAADSKEIILKAIESCQREYDNSRLFLYTAYFWLVRKQQGMSNSKPGLLKGLTGLFGRKEDNISLGAEEQKYLKEYEKIILSSISNLFDGKITQEELDIVNKFIEGDVNRQPDNTLANIFKNKPVNSYLFGLLTGCASVNYELSDKLRNFLKLCNLVVNVYNNFLNVVWDFASPDEKSGLLSKLQQDLGLDPVLVIAWCGIRNIEEELLYRIEHDNENFVKALEKVPLTNYTWMMEILFKKSPEQYRKLVDKGTEDMQRKITEELLPGEYPQRQVVRDFLEGKTAADTLYPHIDNFKVGLNMYNSNKITNIVNYRRIKGRDDFYKRCISYLSFSEYGYSLYWGVRYDNKNKSVGHEMLEDWKDAGLGIQYQLMAVEKIHDTLYSDSDKKSFLNDAIKGFKKYLEDKNTEKETLQAFENAGSTGRYLGICVLSEYGDKYKDNLFNALEDSSKLVREKLVEIIASHKEWEKEVLGKLSSKKSAQRETALLILGKWNKDYTQYLEKALEVEKSKKLSDMIKKMLNMEVSEAQDGAKPLSLEDYVREMHKGGKKKSLLWAYETPFAPVHKTDGEEVSEEYMQAILLSYYGMAVPGVNREVLKLTEKLRQDELALYVNELFDRWMEKGAEAKKKWVLYAAAIHGGPEIVAKLQHNINEWPQNSRGAIAAEAVKALALNDSPTALLIVDSISRKFKFKQIKTAAAQALEFAASELGLTREELADRIVPDMGFNENMERVFDYGGRKFKVYITPALEVEIYDENNKKLKNLPAPGKKDDEAMAAAALEEFKRMKKLMKTTVSNQKLRLELALSVERKWDIEAWKNLFVKNPIMHQFAISLIWGMYQNDRLVETFRYMEDGSFNTQEEEEYVLPEGGRIGLVHPVELTEESRSIWKQQLKDYEVTQSIEQLERKVYFVTEEEREQKQLDRFGGYVLNALSLCGKLLGMGWYRGSVVDAGGYYSFYREDPALGLGVELKFSGAFVGDENDDVTVYEARFYKAGTIKRGSYQYDEVKDGNAIKLGSVPARYFSEIVYQLEKATASSRERNEGWKEDR